MEMESSKPQEKENQDATGNQENKQPSQVNKIVIDSPQKKRFFDSKIKFKKNSVVIVAAVVILTLLLVVGKILILSSKNQIQNNNQAQTQTTCTKPTKLLDKEGAASSFLESDCEFRTYPGVEIKELDEASCKRISKYYITGLLSIRNESILSIGHQYINNFFNDFVKSQFSVVVSKFHFF